MLCRSVDNVCAAFMQYAAGLQSERTCGCRYSLVRCRTVQNGKHSIFVLTSAPKGIAPGRRWPLCALERRPTTPGLWCLCIKQPEHSLLYVGRGRGVIRSHKLEHGTSNSHHISGRSDEAVVQRKQDHQPQSPSASPGDLIHHHNPIGVCSQRSSDRPETLRFVPRHGPLTAL